MVAQPHKSENLYFWLRVAFSVLGLYLTVAGVLALFASAGAALGVTFVTLLLYVVIFIVYFRIVGILMIGHLRGNGVQLTPKQFPEAFAMVGEVAKLYGLKKVPQVFLVQSGGVLNAYATRFAGKDYIALYSEVFILLESEPAVLKFILAHELAHVQRKHMQKRFWTFFSFYVPFLGAAYSRACEYTCDAYGHEASPEGSVRGLLLLAAGRELYAKVQLDEYLKTFHENDQGAVIFAQAFASHPHLPHRIAALTRR